MKKRSIFITALAASLFSFLSCQKENVPQSENNPFDVISDNSEFTRNKIVIISDLHLGADLTYSECVHHLPRLLEFLTEIRDSKSIKELVIAGDMLDEWYVPSRTNTYKGKTQKEFVHEIANKNKEVFGLLNDIIRGGKIKVSYTPGNHDLLISEENVSEVLPGIHQARDIDRLGIGTYHPEGYPQIAIEHGHRYDFFCSPDPFSNQVLAPGTILPPGYFFTRIAVNSITNPPLANEITPAPNVTLNSTDETQLNNYTYFGMWKAVLSNLIPVKDSFDEKIIVTNMGGFRDTFCIKDVLPYNQPDGEITMNLFKGACNQTNWEKRLTYNHVPVVTQLKTAIPGSLYTSFIDEQSNLQYFQNDSSNVRIVVFGHTHNPMIKTFNNNVKGECLYVNSGTWIDKKVKSGELVDQDTQNMDFIVIMPQSADNSMLKVERFKYQSGKHVSMESKSIRI